MAELTYILKDIFSTENANSCLIENDAKKYHIPAYQRGYKWSSHTNGAVTILLNDLKVAFKNDKSKDYYLQYITLKKIELKKNEEKNTVLEVIDGQQRLTTLSILLSVISNIEGVLREENIANEKLDYAIRSDFFSQYIYNFENQKILLEQDWNEENDNLCVNGNILSGQDIFFLFHAAKKINDYLTTEIDTLKDFHTYILEHVRIIVNVVEAGTSSEKLFRNLNSNKVILKDTDLVKALLITRMGRQPEDGSKIRFREILEKRVSFGRQWDEISRWCNMPEINSFFFSKENKGMKELIKLVAKLNKYEVPKTKETYPLFNFFHKKEVDKIYGDILKLYFVFKEWYNDFDTYNLLGFLFCAKGSEKTIHDFLKYHDITKSELIKELIKEASALIPTDITTLHFGENNDEIHRVLLALNVFSDGKSDLRFNFYNYKKGNWSLEHIFPQTPGGKGNVLSEADKIMILDMLETEEREKAKEDLAKVETEDEKKDIYHKFLKSSKKLNSMGNMCLLTGPDNSSNGCKFYDEKRKNIFELIKKGSFVPKHTVDVFSKMVISQKDDAGDLTRWTKDNIIQHTQVIKDIISNLKFTQKNEIR